MDSKEDEPLITQEKAWRRFVAYGDDASFKAVFEVYYKSLYGYGVKLCNQPELVKDGIHDLFKNMWERRDDLAHIKSPNVYLFVSLRRKIMKEVKGQRKKTDMTEVNEESFITFGREEIIIRDEVKFQQKEKLQQALNQLPDRQKEVLYLHYYNGLTYGEIEEILSINRQSVRNHIYRAMETLRSLLDIEIMKLVSSLLIAFLSLY
jgi:RNA polymerase sigma factor (sigma-70 family)